MDLNFVYLMILLVSFILLSTTFSTKFTNLENRMRRMQETLNEIAKQAGVPESKIYDKLRAIIKGGNKIQAIKKAREAMGLSLKLKN